MLSYREEQRLKDLEARRYRFGPSETRDKLIAELDRLMSFLDRCQRTGATNAAKHAAAEFDQTLRELIAVDQTLDRLHRGCSSPAEYERSKVRAAAYAAEQLNAAILAHQRW